MKTLILILGLVLTLNSNAFELPEIEVPAYTKEEMRGTISDEEIKLLKLYAKDIKRELKEVIDASSQKNGEQALYHLKNSIQDIVVEYQERSNIFVRYSLNRSLKLVELVEDETQIENNSSIDTKIRMLRQSLKIALNYAEFDFSRHQEFALPTYATFGTDYYSLLTEMAKSVVDASAQYKLLLASLQYLQWDLYRELDNIPHSPTIVRIYNFLNQRPKSINKDAIYIREIKIVKNFIKNLNIRNFQGAITANEMEKQINAIVIANQDFDISSPMIVGEKIIRYESWTGAKDYNGKVFTVLGPYKYLPGQLLAAHEKLNIPVSDNDVGTFRMNGCAMPSALCVGEPVVEMGGHSVTIVGLSKFGQILVRAADGTLRAHYKGGFYRRIGCSEKLNVCVGDKVFSGYPEKLKVVTALNASIDNNGLLMLGDSLYDEVFELSSPMSIKGKL